jgi:hypothetical protein
MWNAPYQKRDYRRWTKSGGLMLFEVIEYETDLYISADKDYSTEALVSIKKYRKDIQDYINLDEDFLKSFIPILINNNAPEIVRKMGSAAEKAGVGPFAAVAGAVAEFVGKDILKYSSQVIVENGGDIFISSETDRIIGLYAGHSPLTGKIGFKVSKDLMPVGICTSSGTVGHSISFGKSDAVVIMSKSTALADAVATATGNIVQTEEDIDKAIEFASKIEGILAVSIVKNDKMGLWGDFEIIKL